MPAGWYLPIFWHDGPDREFEALKTFGLLAGENLTGGFYTEILVFEAELRNFRRIAFQPNQQATSSSVKIRAYVVVA